MVHRPTFMRRQGRTPPFVGSHGEVVPGSIAEVSYCRLGGVDQWVMIRSVSVGNPPLILLHGGPGLSETGVFRRFVAPLEKTFSCVYWDQRGAGKSFDRGIPRSSMTVEQFVSDLDELVDLVCERLGSSQVALFGHSWGSVLGTLYAARFPGKVAAYVGSGQVGNWAAVEAARYAFALAEAQRLRNRRALRWLRAVGPPPYTDEAVFTQRTWLAPLKALLSLRAVWGLARSGSRGQEFSVLELPGFRRGFRFTLNAMWAEVSHLNLIELVPELQTPVFFFLGRNDRVVPPETSEAYFDSLAARSKRLVWFEHSGHWPFVDEPDEFNRAMLEFVAPAITSDLPAHASERV
jgi:pimeloyl-ACP methyl ester carboxylesterase